MASELSNFAGVDHRQHSDAAASQNLNNLELEAAVEWNDLEYRISTLSTGKTFVKSLRSCFGKPDTPADAPAPSPPTAPSASNSDLVDIENGSNQSVSSDHQTHERILIQRTSGIMPKNKFIAIMGVYPTIHNPHNPHIIIIDTCWCRFSLLVILLLVPSLSS
jgi:hypothetical protein